VQVSGGSVDETPALEVLDAGNLTWHKESCHDPAVSIDDMCWNSVHNASDRLPHKLCHCDNHGEGHEEDRGEGTMDPKNRIVHDNLLPLQVVLQRRK